jgi:putative Mg2+ transporter-C (MgtC) family protein
MDSYEILLRLLLSLLLGGLLGFERTRVGRAAGLRTYAIVCSASALIMMTNLYIFNTLHASDPVRLGAQVISGIGFLGAGSILVTGKYRQHIKGITTAAALWASGAIGLACGCGFYLGAIATTLLIFCAMHFLRYIEKKLLINDRNLVFYIELDNLQNMTAITEFFQECSITIENMRISKPFLNEATTAVTYVIILPKHLTRSSLIQELAKNEHILYIEETY